ncbi:MAG: hypothetical protein KDA32_06860 [Phycisphaerales bacterium]|nr:hypothetical protein [Phycisphaerales bacterium]
MNAHDESNAERHSDAYGPGHPWHYLERGDGASPVAADRIPAGDPELIGGFLERDIPKTPEKRDATIERLFVERSQQLARRIEGYEDVIARGVEALSRYDRQIAYGGDDELAVASTLALLFNQISYLKGEVAWLEANRSRQGSLF